MRRYICMILLLGIFRIPASADLVVQAESGAFDGKTDTQHAGYTGSSFVDLTNKIGSYIEIDFSIKEPLPTANILLRWANGKNDDRAVRVLVNGQTALSRVELGFSGGFTTWIESSLTPIALRKGTNRLRLESLTVNGAPNIDRFTIMGAEQGDIEVPLTIQIKGKGAVVRTPDAPFYIAGTEVTLQAVPHSESGGSFIGWSGAIVSSLNPISITVNQATAITATFISSDYSSYHCAPKALGGDDNNSGSKESPFYNLSKAVAMMQPGDTIWMRGGEYRYTSTILLDQKGSQKEPLMIFAYPEERPILNFYDIFSSYTNLNATARGEARGFKITGDYYYLRGLEVCQAPDNGIKIEGSYNRIELLSLHHNGDSGIQIGLAKDSPDAADKVCHNLIKNCDSYKNLDWGTSYENADGFACKLSPGANNRFVGCRAWDNADDGWDFYMTHYPIYIDSCWTTGNGNPELILNDPAWEYGLKNQIPTNWQGDGNGFKLGGDDWAAKHQISNCISFNGYSTGACYSENNNADSLFLYNCVAWQGMKNYRVRAYPSDLRNCISFDAKVGGESQLFDLASGSTALNNSWNSIDGADPMIPYKGKDGKIFDQKSIYDQFESTSLADFLAPRQVDGSLPINGFGRLKANSIFIDKGINTVRGVSPITLKRTDILLQPEIHYCGNRADLGAYEHREVASAIDPISLPTLCSVENNPFVGNTLLLLSTPTALSALRWSIYDLSGSLIYREDYVDLQPSQLYKVPLSHKDLPEGIYLVKIQSAQHSQSLTLISTQRR